MATLDKLNLGPRRFEESIEALTRDSISTSLGQIEAALKARFGVTSSELAAPSPVARKRKR